jgi:hypothetical protein
MGKILEFYLGRQKVEGVSLQDIWNYSLEQKEQKHNYIQYLFPTTEHSRFNPLAPVLEQNEIILFNNTALLKDRLRHSFNLMLDFYGLHYHNGYIKENPNTFHMRASVWLRPHNHNYLRISRIITSLGLLGLKDEGKLFLIALCNIYKKHPKQIDLESITTWRERAKKYLM